VNGEISPMVVVGTNSGWLHCSSATTAICYFAIISKLIGGRFKPAKGAFKGSFQVSLLRPSTRLKGNRGFTQNHL